MIASVIIPGMPEDTADTAQRSSRTLKIPNESARGVEGEPSPAALRIAFFVPSFPELSETFIARQVVGLLDRGHEVRVFAHEPASDGLAHQSFEQRDLRRLVTVLPSSGAPVSLAARHALAALRCLRLRHARASGGWTALARTIATLAREAPFDVVHCHYGNVGLHYAPAACVWDAPLAVSFYGYDSSSYPRERGARVFEPLFAAADAVTSLSEHMDAQLRSLGCPPALLRRVPLAVDPSALGSDIPRATRSRDGVRLLTVARLTEKKGIEHALRAVALAADEFPDVRYDIVGDGPLRAQLESLSATLGLSDRVRFLGARAEDDVQVAMREADLFLLPSMTAANGDQEGTPTVLLEAAWARLPVLATRHAGIPNIVRDGESGILVAEGDPEALAEALSSLIRTPDRWPAMGEAGHQLVEATHTMPLVAARLETMYRELIGRRAAR